MRPGWEQRLRELSRALRVPGAAQLPVGELRPSIERAVPHPDHRAAYLVLSVVTAQIPHPDDVVRFLRGWRSEGLLEPLRSVERASRRSRAILPVRVVSGVIMDLTDTSRSEFTTGIQRVARETVGRWARDEDIAIVGWDRTGTHLERLEGDLLARAGVTRSAPVSPEIVVPYGATFVLPEIAVDPRRAARVRTIAEHAGGTCLAIGFDCIPVTTAEAAGPGMPGAFSKYLSTLARCDVVVPISESSADEYRGWKIMLASAGLEGPSVEPLDLPSTGVPLASDTVGALRRELGLGDERVVLAVGSHEPRKNHVNFLHAAELNWRRGEEFTVVMVGGNSWDTELFNRSLSQLRRRERRIVTLARASDQTVWDLYRLARFSVFCSINEGFGLPVVESLASGTPVITSDFGSTRALGDGHGALLVDPHDVQGMADAMASLLSNDDLLASLEALTAGLPQSTWDDYASALWRKVDALEQVGRAGGSSVSVASAPREA